MTGAGRCITLVEDDAAVRESLAAVLETWNFVVEAHVDGESLLGAGISQATVCILLDVKLPGIDGLEVLAELRRNGTITPVIILTGHGDVAMAVRALQGGAQDFIEKPFDDSDLVHRIEEAIAAHSAVDADALRYRELFATLTPREFEVMHEVVAGHANKMIAYRLGLSPKTVEIHRARVMEKTASRSLSQLVRMALKAGIDPDSE